MARHKGNPNYLFMLNTKLLYDWMELNNKSRKDMAEALGVQIHSFGHYCCHNRIPRRDIFEKLLAFTSISESKLKIPRSGGSNG